ncbi:MAG: hypothetical protein ABIF04_03230, partial [Chloroflexota bacterium]
MSLTKRPPQLLLLLLVVLTACETPKWGGVPTIPAVPIAVPKTRIPEAAAASPALTITLHPTDKTASLQSPPPTLAPEAWKSLPIVPVVSQRMIEVYQAGLAAGRNPAHFSKIGDCQNITTYFLAEFDDLNEYSLGLDYAYLQPTIDHFAGSWSRESLAVKGGMNVAAVQNPFWTLVPKPDECKQGETPLACELRVYNPSFAIISLEE